MRQLIGPDVVRTLERINRDIRDTKLAGFAIRCRASGVHSYILVLGRGDVRTLGRVGSMRPEAARLAAEALRASIARVALQYMSDDPALSSRDARARARGTVRSGKKRLITFGTFLDDHYEPWVLANRKRGAELVARLRSVFAELGETLLRDLSPFTIERWRTQRAKCQVGDRTVTPETINRDLSALRGACSRAVEWGFLASHPLRTVKAAKTDAAPHVRYLQADEADRLAAALEARDEKRREQRTHANTWRLERGYKAWPAFGAYTDHVTPLVRLALLTGCRRGELFALRWRDVDLVAGRLTVRAEHAKSGVSRILPLNPDAVGVLHRWRPTVVDEAAYVFPGDDGKPLVTVKRAWEALMTAAMIADFRFHDLRHTFASRLVMAGVDLNTVRELLGHSDIKMTLRYAHLAPEHKAAAVAKLVS
jgi:integrase